MAMRAVTVSKQGIDFRFAVAPRVAVGGQRFIDPDSKIVSVTREINGENTVVDYIRVKATSDLRRVANRWLGGGR